MLRFKSIEQFVPCLQQVGDGTSEEEYQAFGDMRNSKWLGKENEQDAVSLWIGKTGEKFYLGTAVRQPDIFQQGYHYFRTSGFQEISKEDYEILKKAPMFQKTK